MKKIEHYEKSKLYKAYINIYSLHKNNINQEYKSALLYIKIEHFNSIL